MELFETVNSIFNDTPESIEKTVEILNQYHSKSNKKINLTRARVLYSSYKYAGVNNIRLFSEMRNEKGQTFYRCTYSTTPTQIGRECLPRELRMNSYKPYRWKDMPSELSIVGSLISNRF